MRDESSKIMFEVYRESGFTRSYRVVYFTELDEHDRDGQIQAALDGDHFFDGFIRACDAVEAKQLLAAFLGRLNGGDAATPGELEAMLSTYLVA